jgi:rhamnosyltransferase
MENKKNILATIVSYNPDNKIVRCYNSIKEQVDKVIIVDNFTTNENSKKYLKQLSTDVEIIYNDKNYGIAKALNQAAKYAINNEYKWLLTLDQDSEFLPDTYKLILSSYEKMQDNKKIMLLAPQYKKRILISDTGNLDYKVININKIKWKKEKLVITSGSLMKTEIFNNIGFFEEKLFMDRVDFDFSLKLNKYGYVSKVAKNIYFFHEFGSETLKHGFKVSNYSAKRRYYIAKNSVYVFKKYFFYFPKESLYLILRSGCFVAFVKILLFERSKIDKIKSIYKGFLDGILNRF